MRFAGVYVMMKGISGRGMNICRGCCLAFLLMSLFVLGLTGCSRVGLLHDAAANGDLEQIKALLQQNPDLVSVRDKFGRTPLFVAVEFDHNAAAALLLANKADVDATNRNGLSPLMM